MEIIIGRNGTQTAPITEPSVSRQHCKVTPNPDGTYTVENLSDSGTRIDGRDIIRATARPDSIIELGPKFKAQLSDLLVKKHEKSDPEVKTYSISHLRKVWENFNQTNIKKAEEQRKINLTRTGMGIFTMCTVPAAALLGPAAFALTAIGIGGNIFSFVGMKNSETPAERQARQEEFDDLWVCPNPECHHSLMSKNYKKLVNDYPSCPYCNCKYVEE